MINYEIGKVGTEVLEGLNVLGRYIWTGIVVHILQSSSIKLFADLG